MKISILTENHAGDRFGAEHGLSYLIESKGNNILFDSGFTDLFLRNAEKKGINLSEKIDYFVLSHGHWDHGNGLNYLIKELLKNVADEDAKQKITFISHPGVFQSRYKKAQSENIGISVSMDDILKNFQTKLSSSVYEFLPNTYFMGEIPRKTDFEGKTTPYVFEDGNMDLIVDDSGLVFNDNGKIILISGCAHSGICNMMEYAKEITGLTKFKAVIGGTHLKTNNLQTKNTIEYLKNQDIESIYPSHCTQLPALSALYQEFGFSQLKTGMELYF